LGTATQQIQQAVYGVLSTDAALLALVPGMYDEVPENRTFPYLVLGDATETPLDTFARKGRIATITVSIYSMQKGFKESLTIADRVDVLLNRNSFNLSTYDTVYTMYKMLSTQRMGDGLTRKVDIKYDVFAEER